jgi:hypothetical protein
MKNLICVILRYFEKLSIDIDWKFKILFCPPHPYNYIAVLHLKIMLIKNFL